MSGDATTWARAQTVGDGRAKALLKEYAHWASEDYTTWASNETLELALELDIKTIRKARERLVELGYLTETRKRRGDTGNIVVYQMLAPADSVIAQKIDRRTGETTSLSPPSIDEYQAKQDKKRSPSKSGTPKGIQKRSPSKTGTPPDLDARGTKNALQGVPDFPQGVPNLDPDLKDLGFELSGVGNARASGGADDDKTGHTHDHEKTESASPTPGFDRFWAVWPAASGRKQARELCLSHWVANGLEADKHLIAAHVEAMKRTPHWKTGGDPTPIRYLEGRRWRDCSPDEIEACASEQPADESEPWHETQVGVDARAKAIGFRDRKHDEDWRSYRVLVVKAASDRRAAEFVLKDAERFNDARLFEFARTTFGDQLLPVDFYAS
ncbi:helix-turn-helix domain-containing protein [Paraburkholderia tropica]|uniref:helix-turn-helix domain-containing protein n=1 Tax=Paraburkholderia tropica TaxID=92647 RepID=UPI002AB6D323|nr:helix-turn-helix domain-containing protein [Paraburkholderia tropica]